jgi:hypothetical protein
MLGLDHFTRTPVAKHKIRGWNSRLAFAVCHMSVTGFWLKLTEYFGNGRTGEGRHCPWPVF